RRPGGRDRVTPRPRTESLRDDAERHRSGDRRPAGRHAETHPAGSRGDLTQQAALTDAAFSDHERAARLSGPGPAHGAQQLIELGLPADQNRRRTHSFTPLSTHRALVWLITTRASTDVPALPGGHHGWQGKSGTVSTRGGPDVVRRCHDRNGPL